MDETSGCVVLGFYCGSGGLETFCPWLFPNSPISMHWFVTYSTAVVPNLCSLTAWLRGRREELGCISIGPACTQPNLHERQMVCMCMQLNFPKLSCVCVRATYSYQLRSTCVPAQHSHSPVANRPRLDSGPRPRDWGSLFYCFNLSHRTVGHHQTQDFLSCLSFFTIRNKIYRQNKYTIWTYYIKL